MDKINIRGLNFNNISLDEAAGAVYAYLGRERAERGPFTVFTPNAEIGQMCVSSPELREIVNAASMLIPDGAGVVLASRILKRPLKEKVAGADLADKVAERLAHTGGGLFLLGAKPGVAETAGENLKARYPGLNICGTNDGYFDLWGTESAAVVEKINASAPDAVFVSFGAPKQERWIAANLAALPPALYIGLGGTIDVFAGVKKRAPAACIKLRLEWLYYLIREPRRLGRMMSIPAYLLGALGERLRGKGGKDE